MSFNLDDLFDTRPRQQQQATAAAYVVPPPPSDPLPPPVIHQDPFLANAPPPPPPPPPPLPPTATAMPPPPFDAAASSVISATVVPSAPSHPLYTSPQTKQPYNPNTYTIAPIPLVTCHPGPASAIPSQVHYPSTAPVVSPGVYGVPYQPPTGPSAVLPAAPNGSAPPFVPLPATSSSEVLTSVPHDTNSAFAQEEEDRKQLEKIIQIRKELEKERERERKKREELETWGCISCTYRNALSLNQCEMCNSGRPGKNPPAKNGTPAETRSVTLTAPASTVISPPSTLAGPTAWLCSICLAPNEAHHDRCKVCKSYQKNGTPITSGNVKDPVATPAPTVPPTAWLCSICGKKNGIKDMSCSACSSYQSNGMPIIDHGEPPEPATDPVSTKWKCSVCTLENAVGTAVCEACHSGQRPRHLAPPKGKKKTKDGGDGERNPSQPRTWSCPTCTYQNAIATEKCDMCSTGRPPQYKPTPPPNTNGNNNDLGEEIQWQDDNVATGCNRCHQPFNFTRRRHHCRMCGFVFCATCSAFQLVVKKNGPSERVCASCYEAHK